MFGGITSRDAAAYVVAQVAGGVIGVLAAFSVGGYIAGAYYFTSSTSFANPAVTIARMFFDTFAGIEPASAPAFIAAQLVAVAVAAVVIQAIYPDIGDVADQVIVPHSTGADPLDSDRAATENGHSHRSRVELSGP